MNTLKEHIAAISLTPAEIGRRTGAIYAAVLEQSKYIGGRPNFARIGTGDLRLLFGLYDDGFFSGLLAKTINASPDTSLTFRLARTMTSAGGKTFKRAMLGIGNRRTQFEIAVSTHLLFSNFRAEDDRVLVNGIECRDRLQALQRIFEHELVHLVELTLEGRSSCKAAPFRDFAHRFFGHGDVTHRLIPTKIMAARDLGLRVGDRVEFAFEGRRFEGVLNRITKRATVLVEHEGGRRYSDGKRYHKFYVPLPECRRPF